MMVCMQTHNIHSRRGFTLIELAIVLAVIALVAAGISVGRALVENASIQSVVSDVQTYRQAVLNYREKYKEYPGDHTAAVAADHASCATLDASDDNATAGCNGNGDGVIGNSTGAPIGAMALYGEALQVWNHLGRDHLIPGQYSGRPSSATNQTTLGINAPKSKLAGASFQLRYFPPTTDTVNFFTAEYSHVFYFGKPGSAANVPFTDVALTSEQAKSIDQKMDDGRPGLGNVMTYKNAAQSSCASDATESESVYLSSTGNPACALIFITGF